MLACCRWLIFCSPCLTLPCYFLLLSVDIKRNLPFTFPLMTSWLPWIMSPTSSISHLLVTSSYVFWWTNWFHVWLLRHTWVIHVGMVLEEFKANKGSHFRLSWLQDTSQTLVERSMYKTNTRVYMLHLAGYIILVNKSHIYINYRYISMCADFESFHWAHECVVMTILYNALGEATALRWDNLPAT